MGAPFLFVCFALKLSTSVLSSSALWDALPENLRTCKARRIATASEEFQWHPWYP
jgi:hypothetical protein